MVPLASPHDYLVLFALAALFGGIGGVAYELAQNRSGSTGSLSLPSLTHWRFLNLGFISSMLLGAVAAVAVSYFFTPEVQVKEAVKHGTKILTEWQIVKVIPLSLIVGSSGGAFLEAMRGRVLGQINAQKVAATQAVGKAAVAQVAQVAKAAAAGQATAAAGRIVSGGSGAIADAASEVPEQLIVGLSQLRRDVPESSRVAEILDAQTEPQPLQAHVDRLSAEVQGALDDATQTATDLIDASVESANQTIDAAATTTPP
jgi:hypothetical protein